MKYIIQLFLFLFCVQIALTQEQSYKPLEEWQLQSLHTSTTRSIKSLAGVWEKSYDGKVWMKTIIPSAETSSKKIYYRKNFELSENDRLTNTWQMLFLGVEEEIEVSINQIYVRQYIGGLSPFYIQLPDKMLRNGTNTIEITISKPSQGYYKLKQQYEFSPTTYCGIPREPILIGTPSLWISGYKSSQSFSNNYTNASINTSVSISSATLEKLGRLQSDSSKKSNAYFDKMSASVQIELKNPDGEVINSIVTPQQFEILPERTLTVPISFQLANPQLWSVETPNLYSVTVRIVQNTITIDELTYSLGLRELKVAPDKKQLLLNGKPLFIKGLTYVEEFGRKTGITVSPSQLEQDVKNLKILGANAIKLPGKAPNPYLVQLCDKYGIMIFVDLDLFDMPSSVVSSAELQVEMQNMIERYISAYERHPSIVAWGIGEGLEESASSTTKYMKEFSSFVRSKSSKLLFRTIRFGANSPNVENNQLDFYIFRATRQVSDNIDREVKEVRRIEKAFEGKPLIFLFGKLVQTNNKNGYSDPLSNEAQAKYLRDFYKLIKSGTFAGIVIWSYNDYSIRRPIFTTNSPDASLISTSGLVDIYRNTRLSYTMIQALFNEERDPLLRAGTYSEAMPIGFVILGLVATFAFLFMISRLRRFREYVVRALLRPYNFYADIRDQRILSLSQTVVLGIFISLTVGLILSAFLYFARTNNDVDFLFSLIIPWNKMKEFIDNLIWNSTISIISISIITMVLFYSFAVLLRLIAIMLAKRVLFYDTFIIIVWSCLPLLFILPLAAVLVKIVTSTFSLMIITTLLVALFVWLFYRILRASAVVFDVDSFKVYAIVGGSIILSLALIMMYYSYEYGFLSFFYYVQTTSF
jgi:hypothetical protein